MISSVAIWENDGEYYGDGTSYKEGRVDQQQRREIEGRLDKLGRDAEKIAANARNALDRLRREEFQAACDIVALSHYPISHVRVDHDALMDAFTVAGVEPGAGR
jgi:hypothetical protein